MLLLGETISRSCLLHKSSSPILNILKGGINQERQSLTIFVFGLRSGAQIPYFQIVLLFIGDFLPHFEKIFCISIFPNLVNVVSSQTNCALSKLWILLCFCNVHSIVVLLATKKYELLHTGGYTTTHGNIH